MRLARTSGFVILVVAVVATRGAVASEFDQLLRELKGEADPPRRSAGELESAYSKVLEGLLPKMGSDNLGDQSWAQNSWQDVCWRAGRPGAEKEREAACRAITKKLPAANKTARVWLIKQLEHIGRAESVEALAKCLSDGDAVIRERARRALMNSPTPEAAEALREALGLARDAASKAALVNALEGRDDRETQSALKRLARDSDDDVRTAALLVLARMGASAAKSDIASAMRKGSDSARCAATDAYLLLADRLADGRRGEMAVGIYKEMLRKEGHLKCAAIIGLGRAGGTAELNVIFEAVADKDAEVRGAGREALGVMPIDVLRQAAKDKFDGASANFKAGMLDILARRADKGSVELFLKAAEDASPDVRLAALRGLERTGDASAVKLLARSSARGLREEQEAARRSMKCLTGEGVDEALLAHLRRADAKERVEVIACLSERRVSAAAPAILKQAEDEDGAVRLEAFRALTVLASGDSLRDIVDLLVKAPDDRTRKEAEKAVTAACRRVDDVERRSRPVLSALRQAGTDARASLLRVLGKIGGRRPLDAVTGALKDRDDLIVDAAVRALGDWPDGAAADALLALARSAKQEKIRILALRGFARVVGLPSDRSADETSALFLKGIKLASRPEEKRLMLAGLSEVMQPGALDAVATYLKDPALQAEAGTAMVKIARGIGGQHGDAAKAALKRVVAECRDDKIRNDARETMNRIEKYEDYIVAWQVAGPYSEGGKGGGELFDREFPPEKPDAEDVKWKLATAGSNAGMPFMIELDRMLGGENRAAYLRVRVKSPRDQDVILEIGSDDGVKVWINDKVAHRNNAARPVRPGEDKAKVRLSKGWNKVLVKITQGGGQWGMCARFRGPDGSHLEGLTLQAGEN